VEYESLVLVIVIMLMSENHKVSVPFIAKYVLVRCAA